MRTSRLHHRPASPGEVVLALPVTPRHVHAGNVMSGQTPTTYTLL